MKTILVTWWTWYIGTHWVVGLIKQNYKVIMVDNLSNSSIEVLNSIESITWIRPKFYKIDLRKKEQLETIFIENKNR
jgi:UDP-glucose 4-epimerase